MPNYVVLQHHRQSSDPSSVETKRMKSIMK